MSFASFTRSARASSAAIWVARAEACTGSAGASAFFEQAPRARAAAATSTAANRVREMRKLVTKPPEVPRFVALDTLFAKLNVARQDKRRAVRYRLPLGQCCRPQGTVTQPRL